MEGRWRQIESGARLLWGKLTKDDWKVASGDVDQLIGLVQKRYGHARHTVAQQLNMLVGRIRDNAHLPYQSDPPIRQ